MNSGLKTKLNLGCGLQCPEGWINVDSSMGVWLSKFPVLSKTLHLIIPNSWGVLPNIKWPSNVKWMNITKKFPFKTNSVDCIYSSHTIEHLAYSESLFVLKEAYRVLKPGGIIRVIIPDLAEIIDSYIHNRTLMPHLAAKKLLDDSLYFEIPLPNSMAGLFKFYFKRKNNHAFLYDREGLKYQFSQAGFKTMDFYGYGQSKIENIEEIDIPDRFSGAICLEAVKD